MISDAENIRPVVLTIAGFDPSGGAGVLADVRALAHFDIAPVAAITSLTFQNSTAMSGAVHQTAETVRDQIMSLLAAHSIAAVKTGMLPTREIVLEVVRLVRDEDLPAPVIDPVMRSSSGFDLMTTVAWDSLLTELMPLARVITPNIPEAERMTGQRISNEDEMRRATERIRAMGARAVLIKGGHLGERKSEIRGQRSEIGHQKSEVGDQTSGVSERGSGEAIDILDNNGEVTVFRADWIAGPTMRGTGCMLSAAIAACIANGMTLKESIAAARNFVTRQFAKRAEAGANHPS
jgi:hydroxymethylpyrimidine kinase/phosphomethylpyrimidine kinase